MTVIYGLKTCDACRAARRARPDARFVDVREEGLPPEVLEAALAAQGDALVNRRSATWRALPEAERARPAGDLVRAHPALMKRPLVAEADGRILVGREADRP